MANVGKHSDKAPIDDQIIAQFEYDQAHDQLIRNDVLSIINNQTSTSTSLWLVVVKMTKNR